MKLFEAEPITCSVCGALFVPVRTPFLALLFQGNSFDPKQFVLLACLGNANALFNYYFKKLSGFCLMQSRSCRLHIFAKSIQIKIFTHPHSMGSKNMFQIQASEDCPALPLSEAAILCTLYPGVNPTELTSVRLTSE